MLIPLLNTVTGYELKISDGASLKNFILLLLLFICVVDSKVESGANSQQKMLLVWVLLIFFQIFSIAYNNFFTAETPSGIVIKQLMDPIFYAFIAYRLKLSYEEILWISRRFFISLGFLSGLVFIFYFKSIDVPATKILHDRLSGIINEPNYTSITLSSFLPIGLMWAYNCRKFLLKLLIGACIFIFVMTILFTASRAGIFCLILSIMLSIYFLPITRIKRILLYLCLFSFLIIVFVNVLPDKLSSLILDRLDYSRYSEGIDTFSSGRISVFKTSFISISQSFLFGKGFNGFLSWHNINFGYPTAVHNELLDLFASYGFFVFILQLLLYVLIFKYSLIIKSKNPEYLIFITIYFIGMMTLPSRIGYILSIFSLLINKLANFTKINEIAIQEDN